MFGYVKIFKPDLRVRDYETYKGLYCGLCRTLGKRFGPLARFTLSYDIAFLALFRAALRDTPPALTTMRCPGNPLLKRKCLTGDDLDYCADLSMILSYYKILDDVRDETGWKKLRALLVRPYFAWMHRRAAARQPESDRLAAHYLGQSAAQEQGERVLTTDAYADPFAQLMGQIAAQDAADEAQGRIRRHFGYFLGKWIYLLDAVDDYADNAAQGSFNPYLRQEKVPPREKGAIAIAREKVRADAAFSLTACLNEMASAYDLLELRHFCDILDNMMLQGLPEMQRRVLTGEGEKKHD